MARRRTRARRLKENSKKRKLYRSAKKAVQIRTTPLPKYQKKNQIINTIKTGTVTPQVEQTAKKPLKLQLEKQQTRRKRPCERGKTARRANFFRSVAKGGSRKTEKRREHIKC